MMPVVRVASSPKGLPIAKDGLVLHGEVVRVAVGYRRETTRRHVDSYDSDISMRIHAD